LSRDGTRLGAVILNAREESRDCTVGPCMRLVLRCRWVHEPFGAVILSASEESSDGRTD
jgi:hypothetical protein